MLAGRCDEFDFPDGVKHRMVGVENDVLGERTVRPCGGAGGADPCTALNPGENGVSFDFVQGFCAGKATGELGLDAKPLGDFKDEGIHEEERFFGWVFLEREECVPVELEQFGSGFVGGNSPENQLVQGGGTRKFFEMF